MLKILSRLLWWILGAALFFAIFVFALNNREAVVVHWSFGYETRIQLVLLVLFVFVSGALASSLAMLPLWWRLHQHQHQQHAATQPPAKGAEHPTTPKAPAPATTAPARKQEEMIDAV